MSVRAERLGRGEWLLGLGSAVMLIDLFGPTWFEYRPQFHATAAMLGQQVSANGWQSFEVIGPLCMVVYVIGTAICWLAATSHSPALPVVLTTLLLPATLALMVLVALRVLLDPPSVHLAQAGGANVIEARPGAYIGLALSILIFVGNYLSLRRDAVADEDSPAVIETLSVEQSRTETHS